MTKKTPLLCVRIGYSLWLELYVRKPSLVYELRDRRPVVGHFDVDRCLRWRFLNRSHRLSTPHAAQAQGEGSIGLQ